MTFGSGFRHSLETLGIRPEDPPALQTGKLILVMATVLVCAAAMGWTLLYSYLAPSCPWEPPWSFRDCCWATWLFS